MVQTERVISLPKQLSIVPAQFDRAELIDKINPDTGDINVTSRIDFHVNGEIVAGNAPALLPNHRTIRDAGMLDG